MRSKDGAITSFDWEFPTDNDGHLVLYAHIFANSLKPTKLAKENPQSQADTCLKISQEPKELHLPKYTYTQGSIHLVRKR